MRNEFIMQIIKIKKIMEIKKQAVQVIYDDNKIVGVVHFSDRCRHRVFYSTEEMGEDELLALLNKNE